MELFHVKCWTVSPYRPLSTHRGVWILGPSQLSVCVPSFSQLGRKSSFPRVYGPNLDFETKHNLKVVDAPTFYKYWSNQT